MADIKPIQTIAFKQGEYTFWRDSEGYVACTKQDDPAPTHCAYTSMSTIIGIKGLTPIRGD